MKTLHIKHSKKARLVQIKKMQKLLHTNRKKGHKGQDYLVKKLESVLLTNQQRVCSDGSSPDLKSAELAERFKLISLGS